MTALRDPAPPSPRRPAPLSDDEFAALMAPFAPFEAAPALVAAVSGGRDSMCLALLAARWAARRGACLHAVTVDHGLRLESAAEARQVGAWLAARGVRHHIVRWHGPHPTSGVPAAARQARYRLLTAYCRDHAALHLLLGHHLDDQGETVMIRAESGSGDDGLAAMAAVREHAHVRLLRPLLAVPRARLTATLAADDQAWFDDPSNDNSALARGRLRAQRRPWSVAQALDIAEASAGKRVAAERAVAALAGRALRLHPAGFAMIERAVLTHAGADVGERLLARTVMAVAGRDYPPRGARTRRLWAALASTAPLSGRTLGGARVFVRGASVYVCREVAQTAPPAPLRGRTEIVWDNRFVATVTKNSSDGASLGALTAAGWNRLLRIDRRLANSSLPHAVRIALPAVWCGERVVAVPHLGFVDGEKGAELGDLRVRWRPPMAIAPAAFGKV